MPALVGQRLEEADQHDALRSCSTSSARGRATLTTASARPRVADELRARLRVRGVGNAAATPAPGSTATVNPLPSRATASGTSATRRSPVAVSFGTPIRTAPSLVPACGRVRGRNPRGAAGSYSGMRVTLPFRAARSPISRSSAIA